MTSSEGGWFGKSQSLILTLTTHLAHITHTHGRTHIESLYHATRPSTRREGGLLSIGSRHLVRFRQVGGVLVKIIPDGQVFESFPRGTHGTTRAHFASRTRGMQGWDEGGGAERRSWRMEEERGGVATLPHTAHTSEDLTIVIVSFGRI